MSESPDHGPQAGKQPAPPKRADPWPQPGKQLAPIASLRPAEYSGEYFRDDKRRIVDSSEQTDDICNWLALELEKQRELVCRTHRRLVADMHLRMLPGPLEEHPAGLDSNSPNEGEQGRSNLGFEIPCANQKGSPNTPSAEPHEVEIAVPPRRNSENSHTARHKLILEQHLSKVVEAGRKMDEQLIHKARETWEGHKWQRGVWKGHGLRSSARFVVESNLFQIIFAIAIVLNTAVLATEHQYNGFVTGYAADHAKVTEPAEEIWPAAERFYRVSGLVFGVLFAFEVLIKLAAFGLNFFTVKWNLLDTFLVLDWAVSELGLIEMNLVFLRLLRLVKLLRLARAAPQSMESMEPLYLLVGSLKSSVAILFWSVLLLVQLQMIIAMVMRSLLEAYILDPSISESDRHDLWSYFGTFTRAMLTTFEMTLGNWVPVCRLLFNVSEVLGLVILVYKLTIGFCVVKVITGVFMQQTFSVAQHNHEIMLIQQERLSKYHVSNMAYLFAQADTSQDNYITLEEFGKLLSRRECKLFLTAMGLDTEDVGVLFRLFDSQGHKKISARELCKGVKTLKGPARALDFHIMTNEQNAMLEEILSRLPEASQRPRESNGA